MRLAMGVGGGRGIEGAMTMAMTMTMMDFVLFSGAVGRQGGREAGGKSG